jgi:hypothetical protein
VKNSIENVMALKKVLCPTKTRKFNKNKKKYESIHTFICFNVSGQLVRNLIANVMALEEVSCPAKSKNKIKSQIISSERSPSSKSLVNKSL